MPFVNREIKINNNVMSVRIDVEMPDCTDIDGEVPDEEKDTISFGIKIHDPSPEAVKISRKDFIIINIEPDNTEEELQAARERQKMIDYFVDNKEIGWIRQFKVALMLGPTVDSENALVTPSWDEAVFHLFGMPWKLLFATIPPRNMCGGWAAFIIALAEIGGITTIVGELATILGCTINLKVAATAITLVAMGTSLPDTSASKIAAQTSPTADSAIGNVTGSNSVNVFRELQVVAGSPRQRLPRHGSSLGPWSRLLAHQLRCPIRTASRCTRLLRHGLPRLLLVLLRHPGPPQNLRAWRTRRP